MNTQKSARCSNHTPNSEVFANITAGLLRTQAEPLIFVVSDPENFREVEKYTSTKKLDISILSAKFITGMIRDVLSSLIICSN